NCGGAQHWLLNVSQVIGGNVLAGNAYSPTPSTALPPPPPYPPTITVSSSACIAPTILTLNSIMPGGIKTTDTTMVTLKATLTSQATGLPIVGEPIEFFVAGPQAPCTGLVSPL